MEGHLDELIKTQDKTAAKLFPRLSQHLSGNLDESDINTKESFFGKIDTLKVNRKGSRKGASLLMQSEDDMEFPVTETLGCDDAVDEIGITELERQLNNSHFSSTQTYTNVQEQLSQPGRYLEEIPEVRATFTTAVRPRILADPTENRGGCCAGTGPKKDCTIF